MSWSLGHYGTFWLINLQILNVQVPFYFKSIVDSMNVDFAAIGETAWTVGGSMIIACMNLPLSECLEISTPN